MTYENIYSKMPQAELSNQYMYRPCGTFGGGPTASCMQPLGSAAAGVQPALSGTVMGAPAFMGTQPASSGFAGPQPLGGPVPGALAGTVLGAQPLSPAAWGTTPAVQAAQMAPVPAMGAPGVPGAGYQAGGAAPALTAAAAIPAATAAQAAAGVTQVPQTVQNVLFTPGFLRTQIGMRVRVEFLLGTNGYTDRTGTLVAVGASYIIIRPIESDDLMLCDIYSIKFVTIMR